MNRGDRCILTLIGMNAMRRKDRELPKSAPFRSRTIPEWLAILPPT